LRLLLACLVFGALAPTVSRALASSGSGWVEVCSAAGSRWVKLDGSGTAEGNSAPAGSSAAGADCPYCLLQHELPLLPPQPFVAPAAPGGHASWDALLSPPVAPRAGWMRPPPQAPPQA
jgi:hypothetical protein